MADPAEGRVSHSTGGVVSRFKAIPSVPLALVVGLVAGLLSLERIVTANPDALSTLVWAEDGLFPLCVRAHGFFSCMVDPFAGYLLFLPRLVAGPVSWFSIDSWPLVTNVAAALLAAGAAALTVLVLRNERVGIVASCLVAMLPTLTHIMGFEAINATGSSYMLLVFVAALAICFPSQGEFRVWAFATGALVLALTIPSSAVLLLPLVYSTARGRIPRRGAVITGVALVIGLVAQATVALSAANPRRLEWSLGAFDGWADSVPSALLTLWPGKTALSTEGTFTSAAAVGWGHVGLFITVGILVAGIALLFPRSATANGVGQLLIVGLLMGAIPAAAGYANNRYFVIPVLLWLAAILIAIDLTDKWHHEAVMVVLSVVLIIAWIPGLPASSFRSTAVPPWSPMLASARQTCAASPTADTTVIFSPAWPFPDAVFLGPTNNVVPCSAID